MQINKKEVGKRIASIRKRKGMTLEEFGKIIGGALKSNVSKWEKGTSLPNNERLKLIANQGDTTVDELLYGSLYEVLTNIIIKANALYNEYRENNSKQAIIDKYSDCMSPETLEDYMLLGFFIDSSILEDSLPKPDSFKIPAAKRSDQDWSSIHRYYHEQKNLVEKKLIEYVTEDVLSKHISVTNTKQLLTILKTEAENLFNNFTHDINGLFAYVQFQLEELYANKIYAYSSNIDINSDLLDRISDILVSASNEIYKLQQTFSEE